MLRQGEGRFGLRVPLKLIFVFLASIFLCAVSLGQTFTLSISSAPISGVPVTVSPADINGNTNENTPYTLTYNSGASVHLTAPLAVGSDRFVYWLLDGVQQTLGQPALTVSMTADHSVEAFYVPENQLTIQSQNPNSGVPIQAPVDVDGNGNGTTSFVRFYPPGNLETLSAPSAAAGNPFAYWTLDGAPQTAGQTSITVDMSASHTIVAVYQTFTLSVQSQNPNSGVAINVSAIDLNGQANGTTTFTRTYNSSTGVVLTAPTTASGNVFGYWTLDGIQQSAGQTALPVQMSANHTVVAVYITQYTLSVQSLNPNSGVSVTVSPNDVSGNANGTTSFIRTYDAGASVALTAPSTDAGNVFAYWTLDGTQQTAGQTTINVSMNASHTAVAVYVTQFTLSVQSQNPASGVAIAVSPNDANGSGNGNTTFSRTYDSGTSVTLTAPATASGNFFAYWTLDGTQQPTGQTALTFSMSANHTAVAVYVTQVSLTVQSQNPNSGVTVTVSPNDVNGNGNGSTSFSRTYNAGTSVTLVAPSTASGNPFAYWTLDGTQQTAGQTTLSLTMNASHTAVAVYVTQFTLSVQSQNPSSGVSITETPTDVNGAGNGTTSYTRTYNSGTSVTLTAPSSASGNAFGYWTLDGTQQTAGQTTLSLSMGANHTAVAVYLTQVVLTVQSSNPSSGVAIIDSPNDANGNGNGTTSFTRTYDAGTSVTLTAPSTAQGNTFAYWTLDGTQQAAGTAALTVTMNGNHTAVAVYVTQVVLTVQSLNPSSGVAISATPNDANGNGNGTTSFTRTYSSGTQVTLTAPTSASSNKFVYWLLDGTQQTAGQATLSLTLGTNHTAVAVFGLTDPADTDDNYSISIRELTAYGSAWKHGATWPTGPNPIPQDYVTQTATIWRSGEAYVYDSSLAPPDCWTVPSSRDLRARSMGSGTASSTVQPAAGSPNTWLVTVTVTPGSGTSAYSLEEVVPRGAIVTSISSEGFFDLRTSAVRWGPFLDSHSRTFTYQVSVKKVGQLAGRASFNGSSAQVKGDRVLGTSTSAKPGRMGK